MAATKFKGKNLSFTVDGDEFNADGTSVVLDSEDAPTDAVTFADLDDGTPKTWFFTITGVSDYSAGSFWSTLWDNRGETIAYVLAPYGNEDATTSQPHFTGEVEILNPPPIGGDAGTVWTYTVRMDCTADPTRVTTSS